MIEKKDGVDKCVKHPVEKVVQLEDGSRLVRVSLLGTLRSMDLGITNSPDYVGLKILEPLAAASIWHHIVLPKPLAQTVRIGESMQVWIRVFPDNFDFVKARKVELTL